MHLPDLYVIKPIFVDGRLEGFATSLVHHTDIGGISPGSMGVFATEIFQEGLRIPLMKLVEAGQQNNTIFEFIKKNVRVPRMVIGDIRAQLASVHTADCSYTNLVRQYGAATLFKYQEAMHEYGESAMRETISSIPDGTYEFEDVLDGLGENPEPIKFRVAVTIKGGDVVADWIGTSEQVNAAINAPGPFLRSATYFVFRCLAPDIPNTVGYMRPISVSAPTGTVVNPIFPAACNARGIIGFRVIDTLFGALANAIPRRISAAGEGGAVNISFGGSVNGEAFVFAETVLGSWGGRFDRDGMEGVANLAANQSNQPIEFIASQNPIEITKYEFIPNSGGPGKYRGGLATRREYRILCNDVVFTQRTDRRDNLPYGLEGGKCGTSSWVTIESGGKTREVPVLPRNSINLHRGDIVSLVLAGSGGYGDPLDRDPEKVLNDVLDEKISAHVAQREYGVILIGKKLTVDGGATAKQRDLLRTRTQPSKYNHVIEFEREQGFTPRERNSKFRGTAEK
jgi:N-methylhydantoinase B